jgi:glutamate racemase
MRKKKIDMQSKPIGIFDSGIGGLTVYREIRKTFPSEDIVYFGDTARVPYGSKSRSNIIDYSHQNARFLITQGVKVIIIACNTATAVAYQSLKDSFDIPVIGVISAGAQKAISTTKNRKVAVIGTDGTINSHAYQIAIQSINPDISVIEKACPLFVPIVEEGWQDTDIALQIAKVYLSDILSTSIDTLVLGCTHYPILKDTIHTVCGDQVALVDSAAEIAQELYQKRDRLGINSSDSSKVGNDFFYVSDNEEKFKKIAKTILGLDDMNLRTVVLGKSWTI